MAQRTEKEETEFKVVPETITPCVNNCGVIGNPATNNMCQKCFNSSTAATAANTTIATSTTSSSISGGSGTETKFFGEKSPRSAPSASLEYDKDQKTPDRVVSASQPDESTSAAKREVNRCSGCRKRVGLTGFRCRCGELFCAEHRYTDRHDCSYDYRAAGREAIARENPVVKAAKIVKV